jgi:predicted ferric reductase
LALVWVLAAAAAAARSLSSSGGIDDDAMMAGGYPAPLPPVENDREAFSQYKKLPPAPMMVNVPQLTDGALARVAGNYARSPFGESDNKRQSVYRKSMGPLVQVDASGKCDVLKTLSFMWHRRLPGSEVRLRDAVVALCFLALHVLFFVGFQDPCLGAQVSGSEWRLQARAIGTTFGHMASADSLLLVVPATRNSILSVFLGLEFDETILFHRWLGALTLTLLAVHGLAYFPIWFDDWASFVTNRVPLPKFAFALASGVSAIVIGVLSLSFFRRNYFQVFYYAHYTFIVYFITGGLHSPKVFARLAIAAMAIYAVDRVVRFAAGVWPRRCVENVALDGNCTRIVFSKSRLASYAVGNYVFLNFPQISLFEWHPFTLSSGPHDPQNECHIKALGDFTTRVYEEASKSVALRSHLWVRVDGPYGKFSLNPELFPVIVLVGGGVGITPQVAALKAIYRVRMNNVARLEHSRSGVLKHVYFIWSCPDPEHYGWFAQLYDDCLARTLDDPSYPQLHLFVHPHALQGGAARPAGVCAPRPPRLPQVHAALLRRAPRRARRRQRRRLRLRPVRNGHRRLGRVRPGVPEARRDVAVSQGRVQLLICKNKKQKKKKQTKSNFESFVSLFRCVRALFGRLWLSVGHRLTPLCRSVSSFASACVCLCAVCVVHLWRVW